MKEECEHIWEEYLYNYKFEDEVKYCDEFDILKPLIHNKIIIYFKECVKCKESMIGLHTAPFCMETKLYFKNENKIKTFEELIPKVKIMVKKFKEKEEQKNSKRKKTFWGKVFKK